MATIRMRTTSAGPGGNRYSGQEYSVSADEGGALVRGGYAEWVEAPRRDDVPVETATRTAPENAARPPGRKRKL